MPSVYGIALVFCNQTNQTSISRVVMWLHSMAKSHLPYTAGGGLKIFLSPPAPTANSLLFSYPTLDFFFFFFFFTCFFWRVFLLSTSTLLLFIFCATDSTGIRLSLNNPRLLLVPLRLVRITVLSACDLYTKLHLQSWLTKDWRISLRVCLEISHAFYLHSGRFVVFSFPRGGDGHTVREGKEQNSPQTRPWE